MTLAIHIGYHKTATTWLQRQVFLPAMGFSPVFNHDEIDRMIVKPHDLAFDPEIARTQLQKRRTALDNKTCAVISSETLSGHPFFGGRQSAAIARRLHQVAPQAHIVITVRSQMTMLPSVYMQYLQRGGTQDHQSFFNGANGIGYPGFELDHFYYDRLIHLYQSLFRNVHVLTYEHLSTAPAKAIFDLATALRHPIPDLSALQTQRVSASLPQAMAPIIRRINKTRQSTLNPAPAIRLSQEPGWMYRMAAAGAGLRLASPLLHSRPISAYVQAQFAESFAQSNKRLDEITNRSLDLSTYP